MDHLGHSGIMLAGLCAVVKLLIIGIFQHLGSSTVDQHLVKMDYSRTANTFVFVLSSNAQGLTGFGGGGGYAWPHTQSHDIMRSYSWVIWTMHTDYESSKTRLVALILCKVVATFNQWSNCHMVRWGVEQGFFISLVYIFIKIVGLGGWGGGSTPHPPPRQFEPCMQ